MFNKSVILSIVILVTFCSSVLCAFIYENDDTDDWLIFKKKFGKNYDNQLEDSLRKQIFEQNSKFINDFNVREAKKNSKYRLAINKFGDQLESEINSYPSQLGISDYDLLNNTYEEEQFLQNILNSSDEIPDELDWRDVDNRVTEVRMEGLYCFANWAFAAVGCLEGQEFYFNSSIKKIPELSEQNLIDCTPNQSCSKGWAKEAFLQVAKQGGIDTMISYPFADTKQYSCMYNKENSVLNNVKGAAVLPTGDEEKLKKVVAKYGPVAVHMDSSDSKFRSFYEKGVYKGDGKCGKTIDKLDRGILIVGYGIDPDEGDYWIIKNSEGPFWGYGGYGLVARNSNTCGIATLPVIATF